MQPTHWEIIVNASQKVFDFFLNASHLFTDFLNKPLKDVMFEKLPLINTIVQWLTEQVGLANLTVFDLLLGSGITIFLGITVYKWCKDLLP